MRIKRVFKCIVCGKEKYSKFSRIKKGYDKYCSRDCYFFFLRTHPKLPEDCKICGKKFKTRKQFIRHRQFENLKKICPVCKVNKISGNWSKSKQCNKCRGLSKKGIIPKNFKIAGWYKGKKRPPEFGKLISKKLTGRKLSPEHIKKFVETRKKNKSFQGRRGEKSNWWKGGITPENKIIRKSIEYRLWREAVFARDNWTCQKTGIKGGELHPHHINNFSEFPELRFAIDNGITLSEKAHREFHKKYGIKNNTREQLKEFLA